MSNLVLIVLGTVLLAFGRSVFWFFVGVVGFLAGFNLGTQVLTGQPEWVIVAAAIVVGIVGAILAVVLQRFAAGLAGFFAGGYLLVTLLSMVGWEVGQLAWLPFLVGGVIGAVLSLFLFDWALIGLSALTGASLVVQALQLSPAVQVLVYLGLFVAGVLIQASMLRRRVQPSES